MKKFLKVIAILAVSALVFTSCGKKGDEPTPPTITHKTYTNVSSTNVTTTIYIYSDGTAFYDLNKTQNVGTLYIRTGLTTFEEKTPSEIYNGSLSPIFTSTTGIKPTNVSETVSYSIQ